MLTSPHSGFHAHTAVWVPEDDRAFATRLARYCARNPGLAPTEATLRRAALPQQIFEGDPLACPTCHRAMRIVAVMTQASVIDQILTHPRTRASLEAPAGPRSPPSTRAPATPRGRSARAAVPPRPHRGPRRPWDTRPTPRPTGP